MKTAYIQLIKYALKDNNTVSVFDGEEWAVKRSKKQNEIINAVKSVDEATLVIRDANGNKLGSALVAAFGLEPDETVIDYTCTEYMNKWNDATNI